MATWSAGAGATTIYVSATENWNNSYQTSMHIRCWIHAPYSEYSSGASWNGNMGGVTGSWGGSYNFGGAGDYTWWEFDNTYNKDGNGNLNIGIYFYANGNNSPYFGAGSVSASYSPARIAAGPGITNSSYDSFTDVTMRLKTEISGYGTGTSAACRFYYKKPADGAWAQTGDQGDASGYNYFDISSILPNTTYQFFARWWNNNGDTSDAGVNTLKTLGDATGTANNIQATTFDVPVTVGASGSGEANPTTKVQYKKHTDTTWIDGPSTTTLSATLTPSGLLPNTQYDYRLAVTNSSGTWNGATNTVTTLPAATLIYPDGTVKNGIPKTILPDGTVTSVNPKEIMP